MKRTFHVWNREFKSVTQIILNTSFWENFTENGRSQIFTFFEKLCWKKSFKRWRFITVHYAIFFFIFYSLYGCETSILDKFLFFQAEVYERRLSFVYPCVSLMFFCIYFVHAVNSNWNCQGSPFGQPSDRRENVFLLF